MKNCVVHSNFELQQTAFLKRYLYLFHWPFKASSYCIAKANITYMFISRSLFESWNI